MLFTNIYLNFSSDRYEIKLISHETGDHISAVQANLKLLTKKLKKSPALL
jgi:hypothetical protein